MTAALIFLGLGFARNTRGWRGWGGSRWFPWRIMFLIGAIPAFLAVLIMRRLKEPEAWQRVSHDGVMATQLGSYGSLFREPVLRSTRSLA